MSVRDRIKAFQGDDVSKSYPSRRRSDLLSLKTDESIREPFIRSNSTADKKVGANQREQSMLQPALPPIIKLTVETPIMTEPKAEFPGTLIEVESATLELVKDAPDLKPELPQEPFKEGFKEPETGHPVEGDKDWKRVEQIEAEQQAAMDAEAAKSNYDDHDRVARMEAEQQAAIDAEAAKHGDGDGDGEWDRVAQMEAEQQAAMEAAATAEKATAKDELHEDKSSSVPGAFTEYNSYENTSNGQPAEETRAETRFDEVKANFPATAKEDKQAKPRNQPRATTREVPITRFEDLLDPVVEKEQRKSPSRNKSHESSKNRHAYVEDDRNAHEHVRQTVKEDLSHRERVLFDPLERAEKKHTRHERRTSRHHSHSERLTVDDHHSKEKTRARSPSIRLIRVNDDDDDDHHEHRTHTHRSHSRSTSKHDHDEHEHQPRSARHSTNSLWPSFSTTERKSVTESLGVRRPSHHRTHSDDRHSTHTADTSRSEISIGKLEFAEYVAGKKLDHIPHSAPRDKSPARPMGFVRSHSHTGEYSEGYTREEKLLKKPSGGDETIEHIEHDWEKEKRHRRNSSRREKEKNEPWQVKFLSGIARG
ncbi:hypothetical protein H2198_004958 [Neophaeococcomyces mojaviensis]|uniref:Uncharacterized protein n=1 Tax=Neophaeococcomyces mojaviensis TaxID=3383035 RepID=A0ACC3A780_9EURO|nr:hypothetical protein H2198_004958 [Knufia sp. JES_112]